MMCIFCGGKVIYFPKYNSDGELHSVSRVCEDCGHRESFNDERYQDLLEKKQ